MSQVDFDFTADYVHTETQEMYKKDNIMQKDLRETFTQMPIHQRERFELIESQALGFIKNEGGDYETVNGSPASEKDVEQIMDEVDERMLQNNPLYVDFDLQYRDGFIFPKDRKDIKEAKKEKFTRG